MADLTNKSGGSEQLLSQNPTRKIKVSLHGKISNDLRARIQSGEYGKGEKIPSLRQLALQYKASPEVIRLALDILREENLIVSRQGKGNFVSEPSLSFREVLVITPLHGHLNQDIVSQFISRFSELPEYRLLMENIIMDDNRLDYAYVEQRSKELRCIIDDSLKNRRLDAIFFNGGSRKTLSFLKEYIGKVKLFCFLDISQLVEFPCPSVSIDYHHGFYIGLHHLIDLGCKSILVINIPEHKNLYSIQENLLRETAVTECQDANVELQICHAPSEAMQILSSHPGIDGIFAHSDSFYVQLMKRIKEYGRHPGKDIAMVGFYNTPWAESFSPALTSVEVFPNRIVDSVIEMYLSEQPYKNYVTKIYPKLVVRESSQFFHPRR